MPGEFSIELIEDELSGFLKISDTVVVAEPLPGPENFLLRGSGDGLDIGEFFEEFFKALVGDD